MSSTSCFKLVGVCFDLLYAFLSHATLDILVESWRGDTSMISKKIHIMLAVFLIVAAVQSFGLVTSSLTHVGDTTLYVHFDATRDNTTDHPCSQGGTVNPPSQTIMYKSPSLTPKH